MYMSKSLCGRARRHMTKKFTRCWNEDFSRLANYVEVIKLTNLNNSVWIRVDKKSLLGKNLFGYLYIFLDALN